MTSLDRPQAPAFSTSTKVALVEKTIQLDSERENRSVKRLFLIEAGGHGPFPATSLTSRTVALTSIPYLRKYVKLNQIKHQI